jgi:hypothetical protein
LSSFSFSDQFVHASFQREQAVPDRTAVEYFGESVDFVGFEHDTTTSLPGALVR